MNKIIVFAAMISEIGLSAGLRVAVVPFAPASWEAPVSAAHTAPQNHTSLASNNANPSHGVIVSVARGGCVITDASLPLIYGECRFATFAGDSHRSITKESIDDKTFHVLNIL